MAKNIRVKQTKRRKIEGAAAARKKKTVTKDNNPLANAKTAKTARGRRELRKRESKIVENAKTALLVRGQRTREEVQQELLLLFTTTQLFFCSCTECFMARKTKISELEISCLKTENHIRVSAAARKFLFDFS